MAVERRPRLNPRTVVVVLGLLVAANLLVVAGLSQRTGHSSPGQPAAVEQLDPPAGSVIRPQATVGVDLRDDLTGVLLLDQPRPGTEIPEDQLQRVPGLGIVQFRPGPGKVVRELAPGHHELTVLYWARTESRPARPASYSWSFEVG